MMDIQHKIQRSSDLHIEHLDMANWIVDRDSKGKKLQKYTTYYMEMKVTNTINKDNQTFKISKRYSEFERLYFEMMDGKSLCIYLSIY